MTEQGTSGGRAAQAAALATRKPKVGEEAGEGLRERLRAEAAAAGRDIEAILLAALHQERERHAPALAAARRAYRGQLGP
jgi:hypothetical protein